MSTTFSDTSAQTVAFLFPEDLKVTPSGIKGIILLGSCMAQNSYGEAFKAISPGLHVDFVLYNNPGDFTVDEERVRQADFQYVQIPLLSVLTDRIRHFPDFSAAADNAAMTDFSFSMVEQMFLGAVKYTRAASVPTIFASFIVPQMPVTSSLKEVGTETDVAALVRKLNLHLAKLVADEPNCYFADIDALASALGKAYVLDDWYHVFSHNTTFNGNWTEHKEHPFYLGSQLPAIRAFRPSAEAEFFHAMWLQAEAIYRSVRQIDQVKLVIFDLDNTLSRGLIAENYADPATRALTMGWPEGLEEAIHHLRSRGILIAMCSKNDEDVVARRWSEAHRNGILQLEHFVVRKIGWQPKEEAVASIIAQFNLTAASVVFVDDNPIERASVKTAFPTIRVIGENQFLTKSTLLWAPEATVASRTAETLRREHMMRAHIARDEQRSSMSRDVFLTKLALNLTIFSVGRGDARYGRCLELLNKTNQFNTTGRRWTTQDLSAFIDRGGRMIAYTVTDKFSDHGLVGVILYAHGHFVQYVMSCRVIGIGIEECALGACLTAFQHDVAEFVAQIVPTEANKVCRDIYRRCGFVADVGDEFSFRLPSSSIAEQRSHVTVASDLHASEDAEAQRSVADAVPSLAGP